MRQVSVEILTTHNVGLVSIQEVGPETALQGKGLMGSD